MDDRFECRRYEKTKTKTDPKGMEIRMDRTEAILQNNLEILQLLSKKVEHQDLIIKEHHELFKDMFTLMKLQQSKIEALENRVP